MIYECWKKGDVIAVLFFNMQNIFTLKAVDFWTDHIDGNMNTEEEDKHSMNNDTSIGFVM